jgi:hypothetical protein
VLPEVSNQRPQALVSIIGDDRNVARVTERLSNADRRCLQPLICLVNLKGRDRIGIVPNSIEPRMDKREVRRVDEVLERPITRLERVRAAINFPVTGVVPLRKGRHIVGGRADTHPDEAEFLRDVMGDCPRLFHRRLVRRGRHQHALRGAIVVPAMVGADHPVVLDIPLRQPCAAVKAIVVPDVDLSLIVPPGNKVALEQRHRNERAGSDVGRRGDGMPIVEQNAVLTPSWVDLQNIAGFHFRSPDRIQRNNRFKACAGQPPRKIDSPHIARYIYLNIANNLGGEDKWPCHKPSKPTVTRLP